MKYLLFLTAVLFQQMAFAQTYAIVADRLIDGTSNDALNNPTIIVMKNRIVDINYKNTIPDSAIVINLKGYTLLPGLMDCHTHLLAEGSEDAYESDLYGNSSPFRALRAVKHLSIALQNGITTLRDVCTEGAGFANVDLARAVDSSFIDGPRIFASGKGLAATGWYLPMSYKQNWEMQLPSGTQYVSGPDECLKGVREQLSKGVSWIKMFADWGLPTFNYNEMKTIVDEAKRSYVNVAAHATSIEGIRMAILAGVRSIEHGYQFNDSLIQMALANHTAWVPTLTAEEYDHAPMDSVYKYLNKAYKLKLQIVMGTDIGSFPWDINETKELEDYVTKAGFTPMDAIKTATSNAAEMLGIQHKLGQLKKNYIADIIAVKGNPLNNIALLQQVGFVMKEGKIYKQPATGR